MKKEKQIKQYAAPQPAQNATTHADKMKWWCKWRGSYNVELINRISQIKKQIS